MGLLASGISAIWFGLSSSPIALIPSQVLVAFGYASVMVSATTIVADVAPRENRGEGMGLIMTSLGIGATIGPLIAGFLAELFGLAMMMFIMASLPIAGLLLFSTRMPETVDFPVDERAVTLH
jgi:MFS family permease